MLLLHLYALNKPILILPFRNESGNVRLTHEQKRIVSYDPKPNEVIKIVAFAGKDFFIVSSLTRICLYKEDTGTMDTHRLFNICLWMLATTYPYTACLL